MEIRYYKRLEMRYDIQTTSKSAKFIGRKRETKTS